MQTPPAFTQIFRRRRLLAGGALLAALTAGVALYWWIWADLPPVHAALLRAASPTTQILDRNGQLLYEWIDPAAGKQLDLELSQIPAACIQATIATEDSRFFWHGGVDPLAILRALWQNLQSQGIVSGASTLTQQLARNLLMENQERFESSLRRKLREALLAWQLEQSYTKDALLALYLNQTYYGNFAFGIEAAAQIFFAKPASQLSLAECALLAGLVQYPSGYNPLLDPEAAKGRQLTVLRLMQSHGALTAAQAEEAARQPLQYRSSLFAIEAPHFVMYVQELLVQQLGLERVRAGGLRVYTTLDLDLQRQAETALRRRLAQLTCQAETACTDPAARSRQVDSAAAVILDSQSGDILTLIGSPDYFAANASGNVNAALARRQPGSAIKPFTYAAALDPQWSRGSPPLTAATILPDLPKTFTVQNNDGSQAPYRPQNYDRKAHGPVSLRTALANSYNVPAVEVLEQIGVETLRQLAAQAGIATFTERYGLALTLGGGEVRLLDLTAAYSIFDDGYALAPRALQRVEPSAPATSQATTLFHLAPPTTSPQVLSPQAAYLITDILADDLARTPAFGRGSVLDLPFPAAVKTGTTTDWRDNWTVGYSTQRIVGVWIGNADNTPMQNVSGVDGAGPLWQDLMRLSHRHPPAHFTRPPGLVEVTLCAPSGLLPSPACPRLRQELFLEGTEPTQTDRQFQQIALDRSTGLPADASTPARQRVDKVYWLLPPEYHDWMAAQGVAIAPPAVASALAQRLSAPNPENPPTGPRLTLVQPDTFATFQLHPGLPASSQQLAIEGIVADGQRWATLRLVVDGTPVAVAHQANRLKSRWTLQLGPHRFWLEGEAAAGAKTESSAPATVQVQIFRQDSLP